MLRLLHHGTQTQTQTRHDLTSTTRQTTTAYHPLSSGGVGPGLPIGILKAGYGITKAIGEHQQKRAKKISDKRGRDYLQGKRKSYGGESFNCSLI